MKHTLPILALVAVASAQTAPASGLNYNQLTVSRTSRQNTVSVQAVLKDSNFVVGAATSSAAASYDSSYSQITVGYVFKGLTSYAVDATVYAIQSSSEDTAYGVLLRRQLNDIYAGLEGSIGYTGTLSSKHNADITVGGSTNGAESVLTYELAYNINKTFQVAVGQVKWHTSYQWVANSDNNRQTVFSVRAGF